MVFNVDIHGRCEQCLDPFHTRTLPCAAVSHVVDAGWCIWYHIFYTCWAGWRSSQLAVVEPLWCCMLPGMMRARTAEGGHERVMMVRQILHVLALNCLGLSNLCMYEEAPVLETRQWLHRREHGGSSMAAASPAHVLPRA